MSTFLLLLLQAADERAEYLVLTHDSLEEAVRPLAEWKRQKGYRTRVVRLSDIAAGPKPGDIRAFLRREKPVYVLLVGDAPLLPPQPVKRVRRIHTDHYYGCLDDGDDWHLDAYVGRLPARTPEECSVMVRKILAYEKTPDPSAFRKALLAAEFADHDNDGYENEKFTECAVASKAYLERLGLDARTAFQRKPKSTALPLRHGKSFTGEWDLRWVGSDVIKGTWRPTLHPEGLPYVVPLDFLPDDAAFRRAVTETVNAGVAVVQFNLHGKNDGTVFPKYDRAAVRDLANGDRLPLVLVFACSTGTFTDDECFAEAWLRNPKGGAVAAIASSGGSWGTYNEWLAYGIWDGLARGFFAHLATLDGYTKIAYAGNRHGPGRRLGPLLAYGKQALLDLYREETQREWMTRDTFETFNLLGDPELELRLGPQLPLEVTRAGPSVTVRRDGKPLAGARVALSDGASVRCALTDATGRAALEGRGLLTVTAPDSLPHQSP
jgi:hypothetical protein